MEWSFKKFHKLRLVELYDLLKLRASVFVVEQNCPYQDLDEKDHHATHLLGYQKNNLVAYSRIFPPGIINKKYASISRIVTQNKIRGKGLGHELVKKSIDFCREQNTHQTIKISAQVYLKGFYNRLGFFERGKIYLEDGIPHCAMYLKPL
jgi:ElaA protein